MRGSLAAHLWHWLVQAVAVQISVSAHCIMFSRAQVVPLTELLKRIDAQADLVPVWMQVWRWALGVGSQKQLR